ncbi:hypothetical protein N7537_011804 [Penicillium hordei]|uniref:Phosphatidylserine decarboxylase n=1 Tax=Penicillium hordei TaxID=40994 RepID=A0AAD6GS35_9EURO|nr:uncharacterized protein N7537_011804 [Penicillium hordei]KAJ5589126.1 hypothetical protein N7537_011804 [Penicillium hordei]
MIEWTPTVSSKGDEVLRKILVFYWLFKQQELSDLQTSIAPALTDTDLRWLSYWLAAYTRDTYGQGPGDADKGTKYDKGDRYTQWKSPDGGWKSFNQWFSRELVDIDYSRPMDGKEDDKVIVQGADAKFHGYWDINNGIHEISAQSTFKVKGVDWSIKELIRAIDGVKTYGNGSFIHTTLAVADYHRLHAPVEGKVVQATITQDHFYLKIVQSKTEDGKTTIYPKRDIVVNPQELQRRFDNVTRLEETTNSNNQEEILSLCRSKNNLENNQSKLRNSTGPKPDIGITPPGNKKSVDHGLVAVLLFGMTHVSSVILTVKEGEFLEKGQNISYFQFGGSDTVTVFQKRPTYRDGLEAGKTKLHIRERIAEWK